MKTGYGHDQNSRKDTDLLHENIKKMVDSAKQLSQSKVRKESFYMNNMRRSLHQLKQSDFKQEQLAVFLENYAEVSAFLCLGSIFTTHLFFEIGTSED